MKKRFLIMLTLLSFLLLGIGTAMAATSSIDNLPGGGGFAYFHASATGDVTLLNLQNVDSTPIMVHVSLWDSSSNHVIDFNVPLSGWDNWGCSITGNGTNITITPQTPCYYSGSNNGCFTPLVRALPAGSDGLQKGYVSFVISAGDSAWYGGDGNGDPRNDTIWTLVSTRHYDSIFGRTALLNSAKGSAIAMNANMLQGFVNVYDAPGLTEAATSMWDSITDAALPGLWNCDTDTADTFPSTDDVLQGLNIDSWEIMLTAWNAWRVINDDFTANGVGDTVYNAVGSATGMYVGRYNETPGLSESWLVTVFPANSGTLPVAHSPACGYSSRTLSVFCYDDNEFPISTPITSPEVGRLVFGPAGIAVPGTSGECRILVDAPLVGFTYTEAGNYADIYPLVNLGKFVNAGDGFIFSGHAVDVAATEVIQLGQFETY